MLRPDAQSLFDRDAANPENVRNENKLTE